MRMLSVWLPLVTVIQITAAFQLNLHHQSHFMCGRNNLMAMAENRFLQHHHYSRSYACVALNLSQGQHDGDLNEDDDHDDDDDDYIDDARLEDWRSFRRNLLDVGLSSESSSTPNSSSSSSSGATAADGNRFTVEEDNQESGNLAPVEKRPKSVSKANEELLKSQNAQLYAEGLWAHESPVVEVGGLIVRMPLEVEIYRNKDKLSSIGKELKNRLQLDVVESNSASAPLLSSSKGSESGKNPNLSFSLTAAQTLLWYKKSQSLIEEQMAEIVNLADDQGRINPLQLGTSNQDFLNLYVDCQRSWQEVCLVAERNAKNGDALTYVLNRPMAFQLNENLARLVLFGAYSNVMKDGKVSVSQMNQLTKFLRAFEQSCAVYIGGPNEMEQKAVILHGIPELEGAVEIAPGTRIFRGGLDAAIDGVLQGKYKPLDFRFVLGCRRFQNGELDRALLDSKYQPVACARALALKQCIQLPKPLWHEVMELCGGELREISRLELLKRDDIQE